MSVFVRELLPTGPKSIQADQQERPIIIGPSWGGLGALPTGNALLTGRFEAGDYFFRPARLAAQYRFIRKPTALRSAADIVRRLRLGAAVGDGVYRWRGTAGLIADPYSRCGNTFISSATSRLSSSSRCCAPFFASSTIWGECLGIGSCY